LGYFSADVERIGGRQAFGEVYLGTDDEEPLLLDLQITRSGKVGRNSMATEHSAAP
jgi:hypothetical protein